MSRSPTQRGLTLIELMIVVAIVAILAAVAYPSYTDYIRKGKRATAQAALMEMANKQQQFLLDRRRYATTSQLETFGFTKPKEIENDYTFTVTLGDPPTTFTATATPSAALVARGEQTLTVTHTGAKTPTATGYWGQ